MIAFVELTRKDRKEPVVIDYYRPRADDCHRQGNYRFSTSYRHPGQPVTVFRRLRYISCATLPACLMG